MSDAELHSLSMAAFYLDLGLLGIPDSVLLKEGPLTPQEREVVHRHTDVGGRIVSKLFPDLPDAAEAVWFHHERWDSGGFHGLGGDMIPPMAAIVALVDALEAMVNDRPYRRRLSREQIIEQVRAGMGKQFSPRIATAFLEDVEPILSALSDLANATIESPAGALSIPSTRAPAGVKAVHSTALDFGESAHPSTVASIATATLDAPRKSVAAAAPAPAPAAGAHLPQRLLDRDSAIARIQAFVRDQAPSPVVARVIGLAASPSADLEELSSVICTDPVLSARVLHVASSAAYASAGRRLVTSVQEAIKQIGMSAVRNIAATLGIFDSLPKSAGTLDLVRSWQHSVAVARLCEILAASADPASSGLAYLGGLCHDMGDILCRCHFIAEYAAVERTLAPSDRSVERIEQAILGVTRRELALEALRALGLPETVRIPIEKFQASNAGRGGGAKPLIPGSSGGQLAMMLQVADLYANGVLLAMDDAAPITPLLRSQLRAAAGKEDLEPPPSDVFRGEVVALTASLARLSERELAASTAVRRRPCRVWLARHGAYSQFDPVAAALSLYANVEISDKLPTPAALSGFAGVVVVAASAAVQGFTANQIAELRTHSAGIPLLWLTAGAGDNRQAASNGPTPWPATLGQLKAFVDTLE